MKVLRSLCALALFVLLGAMTRPPELSERSYSIMRSAVQRNAELAAPSSAIQLGSGIHGTLRLRSKLSGSNPTGECGDCQDPCRSFTVDVMDEHGSGSFRGDVCREPSGEWRLSTLNTESWEVSERPPPRAVPPPNHSEPQRPRPAPPPPPIVADKDLVASMIHNLFALRYLPSDVGVKNDQFQKAIFQFASDGQIDLSTASQAKWLHFNDELNKAVERGKLAKCTTPAAVRRAFVMCGVLASDQ